MKLDMIIGRVQIQNSRIIKAPRCISLGADMQISDLKWVAGCGLKHGAACAKRAG